MLKPLFGRTIVQVAKRLNDTIEVGGKQFILDPIFRAYWNTVQMASVVASDSEYLEAGDTVYVHHFVSNPEHLLNIDGNYSWLEEFQIYVRIRDNKMKVLGNYILVEPVTYGDEGLQESKSGLMLTTKSVKDKVEKMGIIRFFGDAGKEAGLKDGDRVLFGKDCEYEILVEDKIYYRMELRDIITILDKDTKISLT